MKRFHVHVAVGDLGKSIAFYSALFGEKPTVVKSDYAKWMLDDPRVNFAISNRGHMPGVNHLGVQAADETELQALQANLQRADATVVPEKGAQCCYARSDKYWVKDPQGIAWEAFHSLGSIPFYGGSDRRLATASATSGSPAAEGNTCCQPSAKPTTSGTCCS